MVIYMVRHFLCVHMSCACTYGGQRSKSGVYAVTPLYLICLDKVSLNLEITVLARLTGQ